jgi:AraC family transcriptional regulator of adaptative response / DNA-3-methyladenine glycosylase II
MPLSDVAFAAGFSSIRTFNETMAEVFDLTPSAIRSRYKTAGLASAGEVRLTLPYRKPFDAPGIFAFLAARAVDGVEIASESSYARTVSLPSGPAEFEVSYDRGRMSLVARLEHMNDLSALHARVRRLFDLDADPVAVDAALTADARFAARVHAIPGIRLPGAIDGSEIVVRALFGQQITVVQARRLLSELTAELGEPVESQFGLTKLFPAAAAIAERPELFRGPVARQNTIRTVAYALADKSLDVGFGSDLTELERSMTAFKGVGPWTAGYVAMRVLGSPDILLDADVALKAGARRLGIHGSLRGELAHLSPWRSYASLHLWRAAAPALANPTIPEPS